MTRQRKTTPSTRRDAKVNGVDDEGGRMVDEDRYVALINRLTLTRENLDLSHIAVGRILGWGSLKVWRIECGASRVTRTDLMDLMSAYEITPDSETWAEFMQMYDDAILKGPDDDSQS